MQLYKLRKKADLSIAGVGLALTLVGLVMILSSSQIIAADNYSNQYYFFIRQLEAWLIGLGAFLYLWKTPVEKLYELRGKLLIASVVMLVLVFIPGIGVEINGSHRWLGMFGYKLFQPTEFVKLMMLIYFAAWLAAKGEDVRDFKRGILPFVCAIAIISGLILIEPDTDTVVVIMAMAFSILFVAKAKFWHIALIVVAAAAVLTTLIFTTGYRKERLNTATKTEATDKLDTDYHAEQAKIAIGSGGLWGVGFGQGVSKYNYLPESYSDSIFAVMAEELGFVRVVIILLGYFYLTWRGYLISLNANSRYVQLLAVGISTMLMTQALINIGGMLGIVPLSGITLPFLSYGGTSLIVSMAMLGLLTNISRETN